MLRSIVAVIIGYVVIRFLVMATFGLIDLMSPATLSAPESGGRPRPSILIFLLLTGALYSIAGGYVTALLAGKSEMKHSLALAALMVIGGIFSMVWNYGQEPIWFQLSLIVFMPLAALLGGNVRAKHRERIRV